MSPTEHVFYQLVNNENMGNKLIKYLDSKIFKMLLKATKWIGYQTDHKIFEFIPDITTKIDVITDNNLYKYFNLSNDEIKIIEEQ